jgi:hypothetical protein
MQGATSFGAERVLGMIFKGRGCAPPRGVSLLGGRPWVPRAACLLASHTGRVPSRGSLLRSAPTPAMAPLAAPLAGAN